ncbi:CDP-alcohol phosphatidyltransferase family protein [Flavobacteriaceae bacterium XHP0103]|uniref:CDP-alcohol phosphatidyltransferase family protein n=1 Tax=Marixanthotalea marina TaxID=2844359 RepID=UPI002989B7B2|nr:CDP-alcohol phosphatidyltransferase family protein [Marixanthotalea marina]MBU3822717.1 CDP-alcohol phosphatidyltransferase family protein [Marixanthotalea marina]
MKKQIPNLITLLNLFCGSIAVVFVVNNDFITASFFVFLGIFFDFFDGFAARKLNVQSALGLQLDSLADMVTCGLVPGLVMYKLLMLADTSWEYSNIDSISFSSLNVIPFLGLFITLASAYRLAKFNLDEEQQSYFKGLPTPANALFILSLPLMLECQNNDLVNSVVLNEWFLIAVTLLSCYMLNSGIKLFALKFKTWDFKTNATRYIFIFLCALFIIVLQFMAIPIIIVTYIIMSLLDTVTTK